MSSLAIPARYTHDIATGWRGRPARFIPPVTRKPAKAGIDALTRRTIQLRDKGAVSAENATKGEMLDWLMEELAIYPVWQYSEADIGSIPLYERVADIPYMFFVFEVALDEIAALKEKWNMARHGG